VLRTLLQAPQTMAGSTSPLVLLGGHWSRGSWLDPSRAQWGGGIHVLSVSHTFLHYQICLEATREGKPAIVSCRAGGRM